MKFAVCIESGPNNYSAYIPDLPGCVSTGYTLEETRRMVRQAIEFHLDGMREDGDPIPEPTTLCGYAVVTAPVATWNLTR